MDKKTKALVELKEILERNNIHLVIPAHKRNIAVLVEVDNDFIFVAEFEEELSGSDLKRYLDEAGG